MIVEAALCLALNIFHESRGEPILGQYAVAQVTMRRAEDDPAKICKVVYAPSQFSWTVEANAKVDPERIDSIAWFKAKAIAKVILDKRMPLDFSNGATHFHATNVSPYWSKIFPRAALIGRHVFYTEKRKSVVTNKKEKTMAKPFGVISDTHNHAWSAFATTFLDGSNSRLHEILNETTRCADAVLAAGGDSIVHCGDLFHVRGSIAPSVLNPTMDCYRRIKEKGVTVTFVAGNHDMESRESARTTNAVTALETIGHTVINSPTIWAGPTRNVYIPWIADIDKLKNALETIVRNKTERANVTVFMHAPMDGVIKGLPAHGLDPEWVAALGYKRVFSGHYHHFKEAAKNVFSVGALTHQTWGDVGSDAGFLIVDDDGAIPITRHPSRAPKFVELMPGFDPAELLDLADGNYVRARMTTSKTSEIDAMRQLLIDNGAKGVTILAEPPKTVVSRTASAVKAGASLEVSVHEFITKMMTAVASDPSIKAEVQKRSEELLGAAKGV